MSDTKKKALVLRDFTDAGTGDSFTKNDTPLIERGAFANYEAAGLIEAAPRAATPPSPRPAAKKRARAVAKPTPSPAPAPVTDTAVAPTA